MSSKKLPDVLGATATPVQGLNHAWDVVVPREVRSIAETRAAFDRITRPLGSDLFRYGADFEKMAGFAAATAGLPSRFDDSVAGRLKTDLACMSVAEGLTGTSNLAKTLAGMALDERLAGRSSAVMGWLESTKMNIFANDLRFMKATFRQPDIGGVHWKELARLAEKLGASRSMIHQFERAARLDSSMSKVLGSEAAASWSMHLKSIVAPTTAFLNAGWGRQVGLLAGLDGHAVGASLSWMSRYRDEPILMNAALVREQHDPKGVELIADGPPLCLVCGNELKPLGHKVRWHGPKRGVKHPLFFAACPSCLAADREDYGFFERALDAIDGSSPPKLYAIKGEGRGDGCRRGSLHLVRVDPEGEDS